ncbi:MAG: hypothetical protein AAF378_23875, partial [Cyanobacteria bacterium P01_A01_bin.84]
FEVKGKNLVDKEPDLIDPTFIPKLKNVVAENGKIQGIDRVLVPLDIPDNDTTLIFGNSKGNILLGFNTPVVIEGGKGKDILLGSGDNDQLNGGQGNDYIFGNGGSDILRGNMGDDLLFGGRGNELFDGGKGNDIIWLNGGADTIVIREEDGTDSIYDFNLGQTTFSLTDGLSFEDLSFQQENGFSTVITGEKVLAQVAGIVVDSLNSTANFV